MQIISCTRSNTHTQHGDVWPSVSFMDSSWQSIFHLQGGYRKHLPRGFSCQTVTSQRPHKENEFVDVCQTPHILLVFSFYFSDFFCAMTSISGYKLWHNKKGPAVVLHDMSQRKEQNLTLCTRFASAQSFHAVSVSQGRRRLSCELNAARL